MLNELPPSSTAPVPRLTTVSVHAGVFLAHDLASAMPLVCTGTRFSIPGEQLWGRTALALQHVQPDGPYPRSEVITIFARDNGKLVMRFDVEVVEGVAMATFVRNGIPLIRHAPIPVNMGDDVLTIARKLFGAGLPQG